MAMAFACIVVFSAPTLVRAQGEQMLMDAVPSSSDSTEVTEAPFVDARLANPRAAMEHFLRSVNDVARGDRSRIDDAVACLDLSNVPAAIRAERGPDLAVKLKEVIDRTRYVVLEEIPADPNASPYVFLRQAEGEIVIARSGDGAWRFTRRTIDSVPSLLDSLEDRKRVEGAVAAPIGISPGLWLQSKVPSTLRTERLWLEDWQWIGLFVLILVGLTLDKIVAGFLYSTLQRFFRHYKVEMAERIIRNGLRPVGLLVMALVWMLGLRYLALPDQLYAILLIATKLVAVAAALWAAYRITDVVTEFLLKRAGETESKLDDVLVPMFRRAIKVFLAVIGIVFLADSLDINITAFLAGLGLGGLALALAAKDTVENLFGSLTVLIDRPFNIGDWVKIDNQEGTVTEVGFRSTRIRTFYDSEITVPNATLINTAVDNMGARRYRRWSTKLGVQYDTSPERIEAFCEGIREIIRQHPYTRKDYFHVYVNEFNASSLDILLYVFWEAPDWTVELQERHRLFLDILRLAHRLGVEFAFPTRTVHLSQNPPAPEEFQSPELPSPEDVAASIELGRTEGREIGSK